MEDNDRKYLIIHGHFYQPPRENPWTERIDRQDSAFPYHDWNERITRECYYPNTCSRRLDGAGRITDFVNNYEWISFNFGPTLLRWLEEKSSLTYERILEADRKSAERFGGHGNAIAQVYNHIIMPLASRRDQETQIRWGIKDFERRFGRTPEGIWLAETAINSETLEILIEFGFKFIILSPHQAEAVKEPDKKEWTDVSDGSIKIGRPYRCYPPKKGKRVKGDKYINIFFYHAQLAQDISFNHLLRNGDTLADRILEAYIDSDGDLVSIATDGEVYGHHEPFGDMALAYLVTSAASARGITITNFAQYLEEHDVTHEVRLKPGPSGEGTSWSCFHGVGRWKEDCGCKIDPGRNWNQKWRSPLREALNTLRDSLVSIFEKEAGELLKDPWKARDDYIEILDSRDKELVEDFFERHRKRNLTEDEVSKALSLLESQRNALLMFTSCGWFFDDISGIETIQILLYARRAIELTGAKHQRELEEKFVNILKDAKSNVPSAGSGADIYIRAVNEARLSDDTLIAQFAIFSHLFGPEDTGKVFGFDFATLKEKVLALDSLTVRVARLGMTSPHTMKRTEHTYLLIVEEDKGFACFSKESSGEQDYKRLVELFESALEEKEISTLRARAVDYFDKEPVTLKDLYQEEKEQVARALASRRLALVYETLEEIYKENREILSLLKESNIKPPGILLAPAELVLNNKLTEEVERWERSLEASSLAGIKSVLQDGAMCGVEIDEKLASSSFTDLIIEKIKGAVEAKSDEAIESILSFVELSTSIGVKLDESSIQDEIFIALNSFVSDFQTGKKGVENRLFKSLLKLAERFNFNIEKWKNPE